MFGALSEGKDPTYEFLSGVSSRSFSDHQLITNCAPLLTLLRMNNPTPPLSHVDLLITRRDQPQLLLAIWDPLGQPLDYYTSTLDLALKLNQHHRHMNQAAVSIKRKDVVTSCSECNPEPESDENTTQKTKSFSKKETSEQSIKAVTHQKAHHGPDTRIIGTCCERVGVVRSDN